MTGVSYVGPDGRVVTLPPGQRPPPGARLVGPSGIKGPPEGEAPLPAVALESDAAAAPAAGARPAPAPGFSYGTTDRVADTVPWSDEIRGAINGTARAALNKLRGRDAQWQRHVDAATDEARHRRDAWADENPVANAAATGAGLLLTGAPRIAGQVASTAGGLAARLLARAAAIARLSQNAPSGIWPRMANEFLASGVTGALDASGNADDGSLQDRALAGVTGGIVGGTIGAGIPLAGSAWRRPLDAADVPISTPATAVTDVPPDLDRQADAAARYDAIISGLQLGGGAIGAELADAINARKKQ